VRFPFRCHAISALLVIAIGPLALSGCGDRGDAGGGGDARSAREPVADRSTDPSNRAPARRGPPQSIGESRIVSLSPAMTQVLVDLGIGERIVGRTPFCDAIPSEVAIVGSLLDVDYERLLAVDPTHLIVQPAASGTDPELERLAAAHGWVLIEQGLDRLADVADFVDALPDALRIDHRGAAEAAELTALRERTAAASLRLRALLPPTPNVTQPDRARGIRTLLLVGTDPPTAAGRSTFVDEMLLAAGGENATEAEGYPELTLEDIVGLDPERILVLREIAIEPREADLLLAPFRSTATRAALAGRGVNLFVDPFVMLPSTRAPEVVERLRSALSAGAS